MYHTVRTYMPDTADISLLTIKELQTFLAANNNRYIDYYLDDSVDTLLDAFYYLTVTFSRRLRGKIRCEVVTYWGEVFRSEGETHLLAGCRGIYKALKHIGGRVHLDYYQRYL
tara:strand:+ start:91 stop:429 length:339 start_codon:yes stop_codon:yes gene_type:complete